MGKILVVDFENIHSLIQKGYHTLKFIHHVFQDTFVYLKRKAIGKEENK